MRPFTPSRRHFIQASSLTAGMILVPAAACQDVQASPPPPSLPVKQAPDLAIQELAALEARVGGRLGVGLLDLDRGYLVGHRLSERFAMCSTFKLLLAAEVLHDSDLGLLKLDQFVPYARKDIVAHAPVTELNLPKGGMALGELAKAAQLTSDNPAANLIMALLGGPEGVTKRVRAAGDAVTRLDRYEPMMNRVATSGDPRDTTSPAAMARLVAHYLTTDYLSPTSKEVLIGWMIETQTGLKRLRAGLPQDWKAGDKTGTGMSDGMPDRYNDVAVVWPPGRAPMVITAYYEAPKAYGEMRDEDQAVLADVGRIAAKWAMR
jgi:beta-lactamase class A